MRRVLADRPLTATERQRRYRERHPERVKAYRQAYRQNNKRRIAEIQRSYRDRYPERRLLEAARRRAKQHGLEFSLTLDDVVVPDRCPVLGIELHRARGGPRDNSPTLDRVVNTRGYVPDNVVVVSWRANRLKSSATLEELRALADFYCRWRA